MTKKRFPRKRQARGTNAMVTASAPVSPPQVPQEGDYGRLLLDISGLLEQARKTAVRAINSVLTSTYWEIGRRIVEYEQAGRQRAQYGEELLLRLGHDLTSKFGRGFSGRNLLKMRSFYLGWEISPTPSARLEIRAKLSEGETKKLDRGSGLHPTAPTISPTVSAELEGRLTTAFPLSWSHYVRLISVENAQARAFYEAEAIRGGWSVRQLDRQISTQYYERAVGSKDRAAFLARAGKPRPEDALSLEDEVRDPYLLEFLNLKDEYSESELEDALIRHLEKFLLELGNGFTFAARQKRIRIGDEWYRMDLLLFHRRLKCLVVIDLKIGKFTHADAGQMNLYLNYVREHMMEPGENDPVGLILCSAKNDAVVHYAMGGIKAKVFASHYLTYLPDEQTLRREILTTQRAIRLRLKERETDE